MPGRSRPAPRFVQDTEQSARSPATSVASHSQTSQGTQASLQPQSTASTTSTTAYKSLTMTTHAASWHPTTRSAIIVAALFCFSSGWFNELAQAVQWYMPVGETSPSPLLTIALRNVGGLAFVPHFYCWKKGHERTDQGSAVNLANYTRLSALIFTFIFCGYNYLWLLSARTLPMGLTNGLWQLSITFVYVASISLFGEAVTIPRVLGVCIAAVGFILASGYVHPSLLDSSPPDRVGLAFVLAAAALYALYQVMFKYLFNHVKNDVTFLGHFVAWVGIWNIVVFLPLILIADWMGFESLALPHGTHALIGVLMLIIGCMVIKVMSLCIVLWGSPMLLPCANAVSVPFQVFLDFLVYGIMPGRIELLGHVLIVTSVMSIMELTPRSLKSLATLGKMNGSTLDLLPLFTPSITKNPSGSEDQMPLM